MNYEYREKGEGIQLKKTWNELEKGGKRGGGSIKTNPVQFPATASPLHRFPLLDIPEPFTVRHYQGPRVKETVKSSLL